jgi:hypothetical protein
MIFAPIIRLLPSAALAIRSAEKGEKRCDSDEQDLLLHQSSNLAA